MAAAAATVSVRLLCFSLLLSFSLLSYLSFLSYTSRAPCAPKNSPLPTFSNHSHVSLLSYASSWNHLPFPAAPLAALKIAVFVKRWPSGARPGGLERHALTLHVELARRGHDVHVFTAAANASLAAMAPAGDKQRITFHVTPATTAGYLNQPLAWAQFEAENGGGGGGGGARAFDVVHTESVALFHGRARGVPNLAVSWHGIAYETIHSDVAQELLLRRPKGAAASPALAYRVAKLVDEVRFFRDYAHHVATSDHAGDVLRRVYMIPGDRVHVIVNGVDERVFTHDVRRGEAFRDKVGVKESAALVIGLAGRLVKDKGHPVMVEAIKKVFAESEGFKKGVVFLVAGDGPWGARYKELGGNVLVLGPLEQAQLAGFYNALDVFINPTLRAQGLDHTTIEAMMSGTAVAATRFASITGSLIVGPEVGYTFLPTVESLTALLYRTWRDGQAVLRNKGEAGRARAAPLFTASKMAAAYERLFFCIAQDSGVLAGDENYCELSVSRS